MTERQKTAAVLFVCALVVGVWDIFVAVHIGTSAGATVSELMLSWASRHPIVPFAMGVVVGHLFWPQPLPPKYAVTKGIR